MSDEPAGTIIRDLAEVVGELTRRQRELLSCLRTFREDLRGLSESGGDDQPPPPRFTRPPPPAGELVSRASTDEGMSTSRGTDGTAPPSVNGVHGPERGGDLLGSLHPADRPGLAHPLTKRHYDYFAELDDLLARLPAARPDEPKGPFDH
jgi:hypothetical protein